MDNFAVWLKKTREEKGLSQGELAKMTGLSKAAISRYESGKRIPRFDSGIQILSVIIREKMAENMH